jgi:hypothetical protein
MPALSLASLRMMVSEEFIDLGVPGHRLTDFGNQVLIPVVFAAVADENRAASFQGADQVTALQATSSSACWRTLEMAPKKGRGTG